MNKKFTLLLGLTAAATWFAVTTASAQRLQFADYNDSGTPGYAAIPSGYNETAEPQQVFQQSQPSLPAPPSVATQPRLASLPREVSLPAGGTLIPSPHDDYATGNGPPNSDPVYRNFGPLPPPPSSDGWEYAVSPRVAQGPPGSPQMMHGPPPTIPPFNEEIFNEPDCVTCGPIWNGAQGGWLNGLGIFGEILYLRPRDTEVGVAIPTNGLIQPGGSPIPVGPAFVMDPTGSAGFRAGVSWWLDGESQLVAKFTMYEASDSGAVSRPNNNSQLYPLTIHPDTITPNTTVTDANARLDIDFDTIDLDMRWLLLKRPGVLLIGFTGVRYGRLEQDFEANYLINQGTIVHANTEYEGIGFRTGLDVETCRGNGFGYYGRSELSMMHGTSKASYRQHQVNNPNNPDAFTSWEADRLAPVLEMEFGVQWISPKNRLRLSAGYMFNVWGNIVTAEDFIQGVQDDQYDDLSDTIDFDGIVGRVEVRL